MRLLMIMVLLFGGFCGVHARPPSAQTEYVLGTVCSVNLFEYGTSEIYSRIFSRMREIHRNMSARLDDVYAPRSEVKLINENAGIAPVKVSGDLFAVLEKACYYAELSGGAFDPTIGPLVNLWGIGTENPRVPVPEEITAALDLVDWRDLIIDRYAQTAFLRRPGMALDLGAIAKGYAADETVRLAAEVNVKRAIINLGGNIAALGSRAERKYFWQRENITPWRVGVQDPLNENERGAYIGVLSIRDKSVVTSGVYERYFTFDGRRYHHILSTRDGRPVDNGLLSVTIITEYSIDADALSTAVFALGYEKGAALIESLSNTEAIFVFEDRRVMITGGLRDIFRLIDDRYFIPTSSISKTRKLFGGIAPLPAPRSP